MPGFRFLGGRDSLVRSTTGPVARDIRRRAENVKGRAQELCPVNKKVGSGTAGKPQGGILKASIRVEPLKVSRGAIVVDVGSPLDYALPVHEGVPARVIVPNAKRALWWGETMLTPRSESPSRGQYAGTPLPVGSVNHPGQRPQPFLRNALPAARF